ncbi:MAG: response regulator [Desulfobacteraceae bacterium]|nr:response regulator [Desulfobacteraceae bacterium]
MDDKPSYEELEQYVKRLENTVFKKIRAEAVNKALFHIASAQNTSETLQELYRSIHRHLSTLLDMTNFYIAIYFKKKNAIRYVYQVDEKDESIPRWIHRFTENPSLTGDVILGKVPLLLNEKKLKKRFSQGRVKGSLPKVWLGVPLMIQGDVLGVMAVQSYTNPNQFSLADVEILSFVSEQIAVSIERKRSENELKQARKRLTRSEKLEAIGTLASGIAHDFNNTLSITLGNINLAQMMASNDQRMEYLADAEASVLQAKELAAKFIVFSKGGIRIKSHIDTRGFLKEALASLAESEGVEYQLTINDLPPVMEADQEQMKEALKNIVVNAAEAMDMEKSVMVSAGVHPEKPGMIVICVQDKGRGIEASNIEKVFEPYYSSKPMGKNKGTGLGMSIAWSIVKNHQGTIRIYSIPGAGTRVDMILPVFQKEPSREKVTPVPPVPKPGRETRPPGNKSPMVLFMDDDPMIRQITEKILIKLGYTPIIAGNGEEAVEKYKSLILSGKSIAVVILDLEVKQGMGGIETMKLLSALNPEIKAIVASGYSKDPAMENCKEFGFADSLAKPISVQNLKEALEKLQ